MIVDVYKFNFVVLTRHIFGYDWNLFIVTGFYTDCVVNGQAYKSL